MREYPTVLVIDDLWGRLSDPMIEETYGKLPVHWVKESAETPEGYAVEPAISAIRRCKPAIVLLDISFGPCENRLGLEILKALRTEFPVLPVLMLTSLDSQSHRELVVRCMELGANEFVEKAPAARRLQALISLFVEPTSDLTLYGNAGPMRKLRADITRVAFGGETSILIVGESGTGKELVARALHRQGPRNRGALVAKNCASTSESLLDVELFGHEKGAFAGATDLRRGLIEEADDGTLFLDEIGDMTLELQGKLLRALEDRTFRRVGSTRDIRSRFQLVCATNRNVDELLRTNRLRPDFYYRIASVVLQAPPLRDRLDDVPILVDHFVRFFLARGWSSYPGRHFAPAAIAAMCAHDWPGNIRELRNVVERALLMARDRLIDISDLPPFVWNGQKAPVGAAAQTGIPDDIALWSTARLKAELSLALEARVAIERYKGSSWKAEFMRLMYPEYKAANAKGFSDLVKRWTSGPWGDPGWEGNEDIATLIRKIAG